MGTHEKPQSRNTTKSVGSRGNTGRRASGKVNSGGTSNGTRRAGTGAAKKKT